MAFTKIVPAGINTGGSYTLQDLNVVGVLTAASFSGPLTGDATGLTGTPDVTVGAITAASADFSGNVSIAGTLTYEDVTNIDSVGLITARDGIIVTGGSVGIGTTNAGSNALAVHGRTILGKVATDDAVSKAEMVSKAALRIRPHVTNSGALNFAQVNNGSSIGVQYTNGSGTADWDIALQPYGGSVGIGTTDPTSLLHLYGNDPQLNAQGITGESQIRISSTGGNYRRIIFFDSAETPTKNNFQIAQQEVDNSLHIGPSTAVGGLAFSNTTGLVVDSVGSVGIGTDDPGQKLDIDGNIRLRAGNTTTYATTLKSNLNATHTSSLTSNVNDATEFELIGSYADSGGSNPRVVLAAGGQKVGIGTDNPYARNHIEINAAAGAGSGSAGALWLKNANQTANNSATIFFGNNLNQASGAINLIHKDYSTDAGDITFDTRENGSTYAERLRIASNGKIGIPAPAESSALLGINAASTSELDNNSGLYNQGNPCYLQIKNTTDDISDPECGIILQPRNSSNGSVAIYAKRTGSFTSDLIYRVRTASSTSAELLRIKNDGGIGIGINSPASKVHIRNTTTYAKDTYAAAATGGSQAEPPGTFRWDNNTPVGGNTRGYRAWCQSGDAYPNASTYIDVLIRNGGFYRITLKRSHSSAQAAVCQMLVYGLANNTNAMRPVVHMTGASGAGNTNATTSTGNGFGSGNAVATFYWTIHEYNVNTYDTIIRIHTNGDNNQGIIALIERI